MSSSSMKHNKTALNAYCVGAAFFFGACAYAQLNDPDPLPWVLGYLGGGVVLNGGVLVHSYSIKNDHRSSVLRKGLVTAVLACAVGISGVLLYMQVSLLDTIRNSLLTDVEGTPSSAKIMWSILELEEGREMAGLLLLLLHVLRLGAFLRDNTTNHDEESTKKTSSLSLTISSLWSLLTTILLTGVLCGAVYLWIYYQPEMNARYKSEHCSGQFHDPLPPKEGEL
eukprot:scaffold52077_cov52-Attheya_sp.AAC.5